MKNDIHVTHKELNDTIKPMQESLASLSYLGEKDFSDTLNEIVQQKRDQVIMIRIIGRVVSFISKWIGIIGGILGIAVAIAEFFFYYRHK